MLCGQTGGILKATECPIADFKDMPFSKNYVQDEFAWVHLNCALWNFNVHISDFKKKVGISNLFPNKRYDSKNACSHCSSRFGATHRCSEGATLPRQLRQIFSHRV